MIRSISSMLFYFRSDSIFEGKDSEQRVMSQSTSKLMQLINNHE